MLWLALWLMVGAQPTVATASQFPGAMAPKRNVSLSAKPVEQSAPQGQIEEPPIWKEKANQDISVWLTEAIAHAQKLVEYTNGDEAQYLALFKSWHIPTDYVWLVHHDLDDDGAEEILLSYPVLRVPEGYEPATPDDLYARAGHCERGGCERVILIFERDNNRFIPFSDLDKEGLADVLIAPMPEVFAIGDINDDGLTEVVISEHWYGASTNGVKLRVGHWTGKKWNQLGLMTQSYTDIYLIDLEQDKIKEFVFYGGTVGSAGAGLQRNYTEIYKWNGKTYLLAAKIPDQIVSEHPYWKMVDGNIALSQRRQEQARQLFEEALSAHFFPPIGYELDWQLVRAVSRFQLIFTWLKMHDETHAQQVYTDAQNIDGQYALWSKVLWNEYMKTKNLDQACALARDSAGETFMAGYSYATNPLRIAKILCYPQIRLTD